MSRTIRRQNSLMLVCTSDLTLSGFFQSFIRRVAAAGYRVETISSPGARLADVRANTGVVVHEIRMRRAISPLHDLGALLRMVILFLRVRPSIVHTHTPKAGLLGMIAGGITGVQHRVYTVNGLILSARTGWRKRLLWITERTSCRIATEIWAVSPSIREALVELRLCPGEKVKVIGYGSSHGVDLQKFDPDKWAPCRSTVRRRFGLPDDAPVLAFVGRLVRDKGIEELAQAWGVLSREFESLHLLLCGAFEPHDPVAEPVRLELLSHPRVHTTGGFVDDMPAVYAAMDVCVLPSYREGLPNVALECAAMRVPIVATQVTGCVDVVLNGHTGILVDARSATALAAGIRILVRDETLRRKLSSAAREFVTERFEQESVFTLMLAEYRSMTGALSAEQTGHREAVRSSSPGS